MRLTIDIQDNKADFVLELLDGLKEFVRVEEPEPLPEWKSRLLENRWAKMESDPEAVCSWDQVLETLEQKPLKKG